MIDIFPPGACARIAEPAPPPEFSNTQFSTVSSAPCTKSMPLSPPWPLIVSPRSTTLTPGVLISMPLVPANTEMPAYTPGAAMIETDRSIVTRPYPPEPSTMISPLLAVTLSAPPNERHGDERLQLTAALASLPDVDTNVRWTPTANASGHDDNSTTAARAANGWCIAFSPFVKARSRQPVHAQAEPLRHVIGRR